MVNMNNGGGLSAPKNISEASPEVREALRIYNKVYKPAQPEVIRYDFKPLDFIREYYYYEYEGKQYRLPYPKVKQLFYLVELCEKAEKDERAQLKANTTALYVLLNDNQDVLEGRKISYLRMAINIRLRRNYKALIAGFDGLMAECIAMLSFTPVSHSDYTPLGLLTIKDIIAGISTKLPVAPDVIMNWRIPAYAASLHYFDVTAAEEDNAIKQMQDKNNARK
jgi:hypothetical protein